MTQCYWCGHAAHGNFTCRAKTIITHRDCECPGHQRVPARTRKLWGDEDQMLAERAMARND